MCVCRKWPSKVKSPSVLRHENRALWLMLVYAAPLQIFSTSRLSFWQEALCPLMLHESRGLGQQSARQYLKNTSCARRIDLVKSMHGGDVGQSNSAFTAPGQRIRHSLYSVWRKRTALDQTLGIRISECWRGWYYRTLLISMRNGSIPYNCLFKRKV